LPVTVAPAADGADVAAWRQSSAPADGAEEVLALSGLAGTPGRTASSLAPLQLQSWFLLVQLAPAAAFGGLWGWDRRRRYLEQNPHILLRRRARRAMRRQWRAAQQAARAGDAERYASAAVGALRAACAPHFPAEPLALVGGDVLQVVAGDGEPAGDKRAGEIVRRFFAVTDAAQFATAKADAKNLLGLKPELESVLEKLEERLH
jgi:hypothetical protein